MVSRHFDCSYSRCGKPSARADKSGCDQCHSRFCGVHMSKDYHKCTDLGDLSETDYEALKTSEFDRLRVLIDDQAVRQLASKLNDGKTCQVEHPSATGPGSLHGCANYHCRVRFDDGSRSWLMRVPRVTGFAAGMPRSITEYFVRSEYATLKFLETTAVPAPKAFAFGIPSEGTDHGIGVCFIMMEELPGKTWNYEGDTTKLYRGLAKVYEELEKHPFSKAGSLFVQSMGDMPSISAFASDRFTCIDPYGPFETAQEYYSAWVEQNLILIADGQLYPQYPVEAYLVYRFLLDNVKQLIDDNDDNTFFLKHVDDHGSHLMVDDDMNLTGIIDWQMARVVPRREAFGASLVSADMRSLCGGNVSLSPRDLELRDALRDQHPRLAEYMADEKIRRFFWGLGLEPKWSWALPLVNALLQMFGEQKRWDEWKPHALRMYHDDQRLQRLLSQYPV